MCYTTNGSDSPVSMIESVGPEIRDPSHHATDPVTLSLLAARGFDLAPNSPGGFVATTGSGSPFVSRGLVSATGNGTSSLSPMDRVSPIAEAITQPFMRANQSQRMVR